MRGDKKRGFAAMSPEKQRTIASKGGREAHRQGTAHEFSPEEARAAGRLGGKTMGANRVHMATIGRKGGQRTTAKRHFLPSSTQGRENNYDVNQSLERPFTEHLAQEEFQLSTIEKSIDVHVPLHTAYSQWTQFEEFPRFMEGVVEVRQFDEKRLHWRVNVGGKEQQWETTICEQIPGQRIVWRNTTGSKNAGVVTFHRIDDKTTRIRLQLDYDPEGVVANAGDIGVVSHRVQGDLQRFKEFIEARASDPSTWRSEIQRP